MSTKEATTRFKLNRLLEPAGWSFCMRRATSRRSIWLEPRAATGNAAFSISAIPSLSRSLSHRKPPSQP